MNTIAPDILLAEDSPTTAELFVCALEANKSAATIQVVRDGVEVLQRLRADERTRLLPVVILSASERESDELDAYRLGANGYIRKPTGFRESCETIAQIERDWLMGA